MALHKGDQQEAFAKDSHLLQWAREDYFKAHHPHFNHETLWDLSDLFQDMIISTDLLNFKIFEIQENWTRREDLQAANDTLKALPKGLQFFQTISPMELPKSWAWKAFTTWMSFVILLVWPFALGVERRAKTKEPSWSWLVLSWTEHLVEVLDKLSSTSVDFFRSQRELEYMHLYGV